VEFREIESLRCRRFLAARRGLSAAASVVVFTANLAKIMPEALQQDRKRMHFHLSDDDSQLLTANLLLRVEETPSALR
jgi:hypothetical protein